MMLWLRILNSMIVGVLAIGAGAFAWGYNDATPVTIKADTLTYESEKKQARAVGSVTATQGTVHLTSPKATATFSNAGTTPPESQSGSPAGSQSGLTNNKLESITAEGTSSQLVVLSDTQNNSTVRGPSAIALVPEDKFTFLANPTNVVTLETAEIVLTCTATMDYNNKDHVATAVGTVVARNKKDGAELWSDKMVVYFEQVDAPKAGDRPQPSGTTGAQSNQKIKRTEAYGAVIMKKGTQSVTGDTAVHEAATSTITFQSNKPNGVVVKDGQNIVMGKVAVHNIEQGTTQVSSSAQGDQSPPKGSQVRALLSPESLKINP